METKKRGRKPTGKKKETKMMRVSEKASKSVRGVQSEWLKQGLRISERAALDLILFGTGKEKAVKVRSET